MLTVPWATSRWTLDPSLPTPFWQRPWASPWTPPLKPLLLSSDSLLWVASPRIPLLSQNGQIAWHIFVKRNGHCHLHSSSHLPAFSAGIVARRPPLRCTASLTAIVFRVDCAPPPPLSGGSRSSAGLLLGTVHRALLGTCFSGVEDVKWANQHQSMGSHLRAQSALCWCQRKHHYAMSTNCARTHRAVRTPTA